MKAVSETYTFILKGIEEVSSHLSVLSGGPRLVAHTQVTGRVLFQKVSDANNKVFFLKQRDRRGRLPEYKPMRRKERNVLYLGETVHVA